MESSLKPFVDRYLDAGLTIIPIPYQQKAAAIKWEEYQHRKPTDAEIQEWFLNGHKTNIAVVCGSTSNNLVVPDCDSIEKFYELAAVICECTNTDDILDFTTIVTTSKGYHIWLRTAEPTKSQKFPQLDIKGEGGYVLIPPSVHPSGAVYKFTNEIEVPTIRQIVSLKDIGIDVEQKQPDEPSNNQPGWVSKLLLGVDEGSRNDSAIKLAGYFRNYHPIDVTERLLIDWNLKNTPPLPDKEIQQVLRSSYGYTRINTLYISPLNEAEVSERKESVKDSVNQIPLSERIEEWIKDTSGWFSYEEVDKEFNIKTESDKANRRMIFKKLRDIGTIETHPKNNKLFRHVNIVVRLIDLKAATKRTALTVKYPFNIEHYFNTYPGNIIALAGAADAGKTAFLMNFVKMNMYDFSIYYQSSEMGEAELYSRIEKFEEEPPEEWNFTPEERSKDFADVIRPDCINIIDYLELAGDFYKIADQLRAIHDRLAGGICIVALQKKRGAELGRGGDFGLEKPRLYLTMDKGKMIIQKAKNWVNSEKNPNRMEIKFKIVAGCRFIVTEDWYKNSDE